MTINWPVFSILSSDDDLLRITKIRKLHCGARTEYVDNVAQVGDTGQVEI